MNVPNMLACGALATAFSENTSLLYFYRILTESHNIILSQNYITEYRFITELNKTKNTV